MGFGFGFLKVKDDVYLKFCISISKFYIFFYIVQLPKHSIFHVQYAPSITPNAPDGK